MDIHLEEDDSSDEEYQPDDEEEDETAEEVSGDPRECWWVRLGKFGSIRRSVFRFLSAHCRLFYRGARHSSSFYAFLCINPRP